jgi:hypothetical protein
VSEAGEAGTTYDLAELRRCIALCFSTSELRALAEELGATGLGDQDRGVGEAAREVVRHFERQGALDRLVARLKQVKPLMEWPEPMQAAPSHQPPPAPPMPPLSAGLPFVAPSAPPLAASPTDFAAPAPLAPGLHLPDPNPPVPPRVEPPPPASSAPSPMIRDPYAGPAWPATASQADKSGRGVDGRTLTLIGVGVGVLVLIASMTAFFVGRAGKGPTAASPARSTGATPTTQELARPIRERGAARMAADSVARSLGNLARDCDLPLGPNEEPGPALFELAYQQCGSSPTMARPPSGPPPSFLGPGAGSPGGDDRAAQDDNAPARPRPQRATGAPGPPRAPAAPATEAPPDDGAVCVGNCAAAHRSCNSGCGPEPTLSSQYSQWQGCQSQCLAQASKCRLGCQ